MRPGEECQQPLAFDGDHVTDATHRMQQRQGEVLVDLLPQSADVHIDGIGLAVEMMVRDRFEEHRARDHLPLAPNEVLEKPELSRLHLNRRIGTLDPAPSQIEVRFHRFVREERQFPTPDALRAQILKDVSRAQAYWRRISNWQQQPASI